MKRGIFGGSFNPPHRMHEKIAQFLISNKWVDEVIFVPTGNQYPKKELASGKQRLEMLEIVANKNSHFYVSDFELQEKLTYTYQTLEYFQKKYPKDKIYFILGADNLADLKNWKHYEYLLEHYHFLAIDRKHMKKKSKHLFSTNHIEFVPMKSENISSTEIRKLLKEKNTQIYSYLDFDVLEYIKRNHLY